MTEDQAWEAYLRACNHLEEHMKGCTSCKDREPSQPVECETHRQISKRIETLLDKWLDL